MELSPFELIELPVLFVMDQWRVMCKAESYCVCCQAGIVKKDTIKLHGF